MLSKPNDGEDLFLYLAVSSHALSAALVREDSKIQRPVYYISKRLSGVELSQAGETRILFAHRLKEAQAVFSSPFYQSAYRSAAKASLVPS